MFNPSEHLMKLKGKDYLQVMWRLVWFREEHPDFGINSAALEINEDHAIFKATITDANGVQVSSGHGSESKRDFGDFIEKAETKAIGRALAMLGYGTQFVADELDEGERIVDSPVQRKPAQEQKLELTKAESFSPAKAISGFCTENGISMKEFANMRSGLVAAKIVPDISSNDMTLDTWSQLEAALKTNFPDVLKGENA